MRVTFPVAFLAANATFAGGCRPDCTSGEQTVDVSLQWFLEQRPYAGAARTGVDAGTPDPPVERLCGVRDAGSASTCVSIDECAVFSDADHCAWRCFEVCRLYVSEHPRDGHSQLNEGCAAVRPHGGDVQWVRCVIHDESSDTRCYPSDDGPGGISFRGFGAPT
jgi:hypothetical protein